MKLSRAKALTSIIFIAFCLLFSYQFLIFAQQPTTNIPAELQELLQGKSSDFSSAASQLKETDLPTVLAVIELLKFKALHQEISANVDKINAFESQIKSKLAKSSVVSFSKTDTCCKKIEAKEIEIAGQKLVIPEYYIAEVSLAITGVIPTGEAGTVFPDIQINIFSQSALTEYGLFIDGKAIPNNKISIFKDSDELGLIFRPDLNIDSIMTIGTHTAKISISNVDGEKAEKQWSFTVGIRDVPTPPLPAGSRIIKEISVDPSVVLPGCKIAANLSVVIYQDSEGRRYSEYKLTSPTGSFVSSRNPAFIARRMNSNDTMRNDRLTVLPRISHAFIGNNITFNYGYSGPGTIESVSWDINSNGVAFTEPSIIIHGNTVVKCTVSGKIQTGSGENDHYSFVEKSQRIIRILTLRTEIYSYRQSIIGSIKPHTFDLEGRVYTGQYPFELSEGANFPAGNETDAVPGTLRVNRLRWKIITTDCHPKIEDETATATSIVFSDHGFAEVVFDVDLTYSQDGRDLKGTFAPQSSALYAFYPVEGKAELEKSYPGQLVNTRRSLTFKRIDFKIKGQQRIIQNEAECNLRAPIKLCESILWPASSPLEIRAVIPIMATENPGKDEDDDSEDDEDDGDDINNPILEYISRFNFYTRPWPEPCQKQLSCYAMFLSWALPDDSEKSIEAEYGIPFISQLPPMTVFKAEDVLESKLEPSQPQTIPEGMEVEFKAALTPRPDLGEGILSKESQDTAKFNVLDGYKVKALPDIEWFEDPDWIDNTNWNSNPVAAAFSHIFKPTHGIGSYTLRCRFNFELEESETKDSSKVVIENEVPVSAIPGLRLLSPINKLVYPLDQTIKVTTTMDSQDEWEDITWKLNGEKFDPPGEDPGFPLLLDKAGKWSIEARLETINPNTGKLIPLISSATFEVKPLNIAITPAKQVSKFVQGLKLPIEVVAKFDNSIVEAPGKEFYWADKTKAIIDPVQWAAVSVPENCADLDSDPQSFKAECEFNAAGAATVLATVTLRIVGAEALFKKAHKGFKDKFEEQVFEFPVTRADLWAFEPATWKELYSDLSDKLFPSQAVSPAGRTFTIKDGLVKFDGKEYPWATETGFNEQISIPAALQDETSTSATCSKIEFEWSCADNSPSNSITFVPTFKKSGLAVVKLKSSLIFNGSDAIPFVEKEFPVSVQGIETLVRYYIDPEIHQMTLGETKQFSFFINPIAAPGPAKNNRSLEFSVLNDIYKVTVDKIDWSWVIASETFSMRADSVFDFTPAISGVYSLSCNAYCSIIEDRLPQLGNSPSWPWNPISIANVNVINEKPEIMFYVDDVSLNDSPKIYLGQKIKLSFKAFLNGESVSIGSYTWQVDQPFTSEFRIIGDDQSASEIIPGKVIDGQPVEFLVYSYDRNDKRKTFHLTYSYDGQTYSQAGEFSFLGPVIEKYGYKQAKPEIYRAGTVMRCGYYPPNHHVDYITLKNTTDTMFSICAAQLVSLKFARSFDDSSKEGFEFSNYLDNGFPYTKTDPIVGEVFPGQSLNDKKFFEDVPNYPFQEVATASMPILYESKSNFSVFVFFRPDLPNSYWVPVLRYNWLWRADSERVDEIWSEIPGAFFPPASLNIEYVKEVPLNNNEASELGFPKWNKYYDNKDGYPWKKM
ncbi:MAG: hypothetical protein ACOYXC_17275 [Candidatus Rifleibacteriota bacterium]